MNPTTCHLLWQTFRRRGQQAEPALADGLHVGAVLLQPQGAHHHPTSEQGDFDAVQEVGADHAGPVGALAAAVPAPGGRHAEVRAQRAAHDPPGDGLGHRRAAPYGGERPRGQTPDLSIAQRSDTDPLYFFTFVSLSFVDFSDFSTNCCQKQPVAVDAAYTSSKARAKTKLVPV